MVVKGEIYNLWQAGSLCLNVKDIILETTPEEGGIFLGSFGGKVHIGVAKAKLATVKTITENEMDWKFPQALSCLDLVKKAADLASGMLQLLSRQVRCPQRLSL